ncbi:MAG: hypothetical protein UZ02_AOB001001387 [Nitrosomonas europaea]|nr:MAG: hypothetical protein UZ02_AOB001001387 [Nitrosomonas europaea]
MIKTGYLRMLVRKYLPDFNVPMIDFISVSLIAGGKLADYLCVISWNSGNTLF